MTETTRTANAMDRLSDWVGSFVPGCSFLGPRHPLKVSLVMGGLGLIGGWIMSAIGMVSILVVTQHSDVAFLMPVSVILCLAVPGFFVMTPFAVWREDGIPHFSRMIPVCMIAHVVASPFILLIGVEPFIGLFCFAFALTTMNVAFATGTSPYEVGIYAVAISATTLTGALSVGAVVWLADFGLAGSLPELPFLWWSASCVLGTYYATLGASLGFAVWDPNPPPRFEAVAINPQPDGAP